MSRKLALSLVGGTTAATIIIVPSVLLTTNQGGDKVTAESLKNDWNGLSETGTLALEGLSDVSANEVTNWNTLVSKIINDTEQNENIKLRDFINKAMINKAVFDGSDFIILDNSVSVKLKIKIGDNPAVETNTLILTGFASSPTPPNPDPIPPNPTGVLTKEIADKLVAYKKSKNENTLYETDLKGFTTIADYAFQNNNYFVSVEIPDSITTIGKTAFEASLKLEKVKISKNSKLTLIDDWAFDGCSALKSINIPNSVVTIGEGAFFGCSALTEIIIPNSVISIGKLAFKSCSKLVSVTLNYKHFDNLKNIGFDEPEAKINWVWTGDFPKGETEILTKGLAKQIANYKQLVEKSTNLNASDLAGYSSIDSNAFANNKYFKSLEIPSNIKNIGSNAFSNCSSLTSIKILHRINMAGQNAFSGCSALVSIVLNNKNFKDFETLGFTNEQKDLVTWEGGSIMPTPSGALTSEKVIQIRKYKEEIKSKALTSKDLSGYTSIDKFAFSNDKYFNSIEIPNSVVSIGYSAFASSSISSITIASSVKSIGDYAFSNCSKLETINIPNGVNSIGDGAFKNCTSLKAINISNVLSIGNYVFYGCTSLKSIAIPNSVVSIGNFAFAECSSLVSIIIPDKVRSIGTSAFYNCSALKTLSISQSAIQIGNNAFGGCSSLNSVKIPSSFNNKEKLLYIGLQENSKNIAFTWF